MRFLATQSYSKIHREVTSIGKKEVEDKRTMYLYPDKITTAYHVFPLEEVNDLSFRKVGKAGGLLYVHTNSGIFSYTVATSPVEFIRTYKIHVGKEVN